MNRIASFLIVLLTVWATCLNVDAQTTNEKSSGVGITASLQSSQLDILVPIWLNDNISLSPAIGLAWEEGTGADLRIGVVPRFYLYRGVVSPYIGARAVMLKTIPASGSGVTPATDWLAGLSFGGEYFISAHFSVGVESQANFTFSSSNSGRFGNPGKTNFNTAAAVFATVYF